MPTLSSTAPVEGPTRAETVDESNNNVVEVQPEEPEEEPEEDEEKELERLMRNWLSVLYRFFDQIPKIIKTINRFLNTGDAKSTGNLKKHAIVCWGLEAVEAVVAMENQSAARPAIEKLGRSGSITDTFKRELESDISYAMDCWTSPNHRTFLDLFAYFVEEGKCKSILPDFIEVPGSHTGECLGYEIKGVLNEFRVKQKVSTLCMEHDMKTHHLWILGMTIDNASNNNTMVAVLASRLNDFPGAPNQVRRFAHIVNLVAKTILHQFDSTQKCGNKRDKEAREAKGEKIVEDLLAKINLDELELNEESVEESAEEHDNNDVDSWVDKREDLTQEETSLGISLIHQNHIICTWGDA
ncbi:hypothetical protein PsYK624_164240 [Phanerochaete sordida]|uniref:Uncharacterized protein n=1 Tax=Phanerochaete sordida TaxID=48140 RepID=A0A9P3GW91_9APHY|nr:hypothetical protein PsYK624_164240 [Phanerochaete sordida]